MSGNLNLEMSTEKDGFVFLDYPDDTSNPGNSNDSQSSRDIFPIASDRNLDSSWIKLEFNAENRKQVLFSEIQVESDAAILDACKGSEAISGGVIGEDAIGTKAMGAEEDHIKKEIENAMLEEPFGAYAIGPKAITATKDGCKGLKDVFGEAIAAVAFNPKDICLQIDFGIEDNGSKGIRKEALGVTAIGSEVFGAKKNIGVENINELPNTKGAFEVEDNATDVLDPKYVCLQIDFGIEDNGSMGIRKEAIDRDAIGETAIQVDKNLNVEYLGATAIQMEKNSDVEHLGATASQVEKNLDVECLGAKAIQKEKNLYVEYLGSTAIQVEKNSDVKYLGATAIQVEKNLDAECLGAKAIQKEKNLYVEYLGSTAIQVEKNSDVKYLGATAIQVEKNLDVECLGAKDIQEEKNLDVKYLGAKAIPGGLFDKENIDPDNTDPKVSGTDLPAMETTSTGASESSGSSENQKAMSIGSYVCGKVNNLVLLTQALIEVMDKEFWSVDESEDDKSPSNN